MTAAPRTLLPWLSCLAVMALASIGSTADTGARNIDRASVEFFEREIRPLLAERCQACHSEKEARGGLRLSGGAEVRRGGSRGPAVTPGKPDQSLLIRAVEHAGPLKMPPAGKLSPAEIARLRRWVAMGAPWPETRPVAPGQPAGEFRPTDAQRRWWAFQPLRAAAPPGVPGETEIDRFLQAELRRRRLPVATPAHRRALIRRATFDLTGLPPTPEETAAFLADGSPGAFARVVDRLLASPAYGRRVARHWLDVVRYADYHDPNPAARDLNCEPKEAWRYRDWVVASLNSDMPFDRFIRHQIAGDLLPSPDGKEFYADGLVATTFLTNGSWDRGDADKEKLVSDMVDDQIDTVGKAFLGLTLGCARCHDHKYDPISQRDYYALAGIFYSTRILLELGAKGGNYTLLRVPLAPASYVEKRDRLGKQLNEVTAKLAELEKRNPPAPADDPERRLLIAERDRLRAELPPPPDFAEAVQEGGTPGGLFPRVGDVPIHIRGSYTRLGEVVPRGMPRFFAGDRQPPIRSGSGRRELAEWVASARNPLTARVIVNRAWQWHFGAGLVSTPNNLGLLSEPPSHPELLDWLAARFIEDGWSLKALHRRIMLTAAYAWSTAAPAELLRRDPDNRFLGRFSPRRLDAEEIRDAMLAVTGRLEPVSRGPATADLDSPRPSLYVQTSRWDRNNFAILFDAANPDASVERRAVSTVAPQSLFLMNHPFAVAQARRLAERLIREVPVGPAARLHRAAELLYSRPASPEELRIALSLLLRPDRRGELDAWTDLCHVLLCSNEFVYLD